MYKQYYCIGYQSFCFKVTSNKKKSNFCYTLFITHKQMNISTEDFQINELKVNEEMRVTGNGASTLWVSIHPYVLSNPPASYNQTRLVWLETASSSAGPLTRLAARRTKQDFIVTSWWQLLLIWPTQAKTSSTRLSERFQTDFAACEVAATNCWFQLWFLQKRNRVRKINVVNVMLLFNFAVSFLLLRCCIL